MTYKTWVQAAIDVDDLRCIHDLQTGEGGRSLHIVFAVSLE